MTKKIVSVLLAVMMVCGLVPLSAVHAFADGLTADYTLSVGQPLTVEITEGGAEKKCAFTPGEDGVYIFESFSENDDTYGTLYDADGDVIDENDDSGTDSNFLIEVQLSADTTYYLGARYYHADTTGSFDVSVTQKPHATALTIDEGSSYEGYVGTSVQLNTSFSPSNAISETVSWTSSDGSIADVDSDGYVSLVSIGTATITATSERGLTATIAVTVTDVPSISAGDTKVVNITEGGSSAYFKFVPNETATYRFYSVGSSDTYGYVYDGNMNLLASNDDYGSNRNFGIVYEMTAGETYFLRARFYSGEITGSFSVKLMKSVPATGMTFAQGSTVNGKIGQYLTLDVVFTPDGGEEEEIVSWTSSDETVATVSNGEISFISEGTATVTATSENGLTASCTVIVTDYETMTVGETKNAVISYGGDTVYFKIKPASDICAAFESTGSKDTYASLYDADMTVLISNDDGGSNQNFLIQYQLTGGETYYLGVRYYGSSETGTIAVTSREVAMASSLAFEHGTSFTAYPLFGAYLNVVAVPANTYVGELTWSSSDEDVVTVDNSGYVTPVSLGTATVTASDSRGLSVSTTVTVRDYETLTTDATQTVNIIHPGYRAVYRFVPAASDHYAFYSDDEDYRTDAYLADSDGELYCDGSYNGSGFRLSTALEAGETYYLVTGFTDSSYTGSFTVGVEQTVYVTDLEILSTPDRLTYVNGFTGRYMDFTGLSARIAWSDGEVTDWSDGESRTIRGEYLNLLISGSTVYVRCGDGEDSYQLTLIDNPVASLTVTRQTTTTLTEETDGYWKNDDGAPYFYYDYGSLSDMEVLITYNDGSETTAHAGDTVNDYPIEIEDDQETQHWTVGQNTVTVSYLGVETTATVTVEESPVSSIEILSSPVFELMENGSGWTEERYNPDTEQFESFFYYSFSGVNQIKVRIHFKNGTSEDAYVNDRVDGYRVEADTNQYSKPYTVGSDNEITVSYLGKTATVPVTVIENPVASIELASPYTALVYENVDGYWRNGDVDTFYIYYLPDVDDVSIVIHYKDGSSVTAKAGDTIDGYQPQTDSDQYRRHWTLGSGNVMYISYLGVRAEVPVTVLPNPVAGIAVTKNTAQTLIENSDGYWSTSYNPDTGDYDINYFRYTLPDMSDAEVTITYVDGSTKTAHIGDTVDGYTVTAGSNQSDEPWTVGSNDVTVEYFGRETTMPIQVVETPAASITVNSAPTREYVYGDMAYGGEDNFMPTDMTGLRFTVNFKNGTSKTYTDADIDENGKIDGHPYEAEAVSDTQTVGSNAVTFRYLGLETTYNVNVRDNSVSAIEVVRLPDKPVCSRYYTPDWRGMQVKFTKQNGTSQVVTLSDANLVYGFTSMIGFSISFEYDGATAFIMTRYLDDDLKTFFVMYGSLQANIEGINYRQDKTVTGVQVEDFAVNCGNMLLKVTYEDATTENIRLTDVKDSRTLWGMNNYYYNRVMTDKGLLSVQTGYGNTGSNYVYVFGMEPEMDASSSVEIWGDIDGDGAVTINDATRLQSYLVEYSVPSFKRIAQFGDVNRDGKINVNDTTALQRYLADVENLTGIGAPMT